MLLAIRRWRSERSVSAWAWKSSESVRRFSMVARSGLGPTGDPEGDVTGFWSAARPDISANRRGNPPAISRRRAGRPAPTVTAWHSLRPRSVARSLLRLPWPCWRCSRAGSRRRSAAPRGRGRRPRSSRCAASPTARADACRPAARVEVEVGHARPAPAPGALRRACEPYLPPDARLWGRTRIGAALPARARRAGTSTCRHREGLRRGAGRHARPARRQRADRGRPGSSRGRSGRRSGCGR